MQKFTLLGCSLCAIVAMGIGFSSCKDDEPFVKPNLSVETESITVAESAGTVDVKFVLDKGAPGDITIEYELRGTAISPADYTIVGTEGEVEIANGETSGIVKIQIAADAIYEGNETIEVSIESVSSTDVVITNDDETEVTITDDDPQVTLSMATATLALNEDQTEYVVEINLSAASTQPITVGYAITGTAVEAHIGAATTPNPIPPQYWDYAVDIEEIGELVIPAGASKGEIPLVIFSDFVFEPTAEEIIITLNDASNGVQIGSGNKTTITLTQQNGKALGLLWSNAHTDVDMDLFLWDVGADPDELLAIAARPSTTIREEIVFIPAVYEEGSLGASYVYYEGTANPMNFEVHFADYVNGVLEAVANQDVFQGSYTLANINKWDAQNAPEPTVVQTFELSASGVTNISTPITIPTTGSRIATSPLPKGTNKARFANPNMLKKYFTK